MPSMGFVQQLGIGALMTLQVATCAYLLALALGTTFALATLRPHPLVKAIWLPYASIFTGVPSLLVGFLFYYGGSQALGGLFALIGVDVNVEVTPFMAAVAALGMVYGAYLADLIATYCL